ncbi:MAG: hypothetical protein KGM96_15410 [Acidobacteriota bacterium]|nr:hypothetical protein [Xanthomonadaceae bacterium]MDE3188899.1 hypothetical protein [Acidobacteriota bacterium]
MANAAYNPTTTRVPPSMVTGPNCITVPIGNDFTRGRHSFQAGDLMVVDLDAVPKHDDFVIVMAQRGPFGRVCDVPPADGQSRDRMVMGVLDSDGETMHFIDLGAGGRAFGVVTGVIAGDKSSRRLAA